MEKSFEKHPAYQEEDLEIETPKELEKAKKKAGVAKDREEILERLGEDIFYIEYENFFKGPFTKKELEDIRIYKGGIHGKVFTKEEFDYKMRIRNIP